MCPSNGTLYGFPASVSKTTTTYDGPFSTVNGYVMKTPNGAKYFLTSLYVGSVV